MFWRYAIDSSKVYLSLGGKQQEFGMYMERVCTIQRLGVYQSLEGLR